MLLIVLLIPSVAHARTVKISAQSAVVMDAYSTKVLYSKKSREKLPMASTTKLMTCLLACESGRSGDIVTITGEMLEGTEGTLIYLKVGDRISLLDLIKGAMLASGNDAANAIAVYLANSVKEFVKLMNLRAAELGMNSTKFVTPSGLDSGNHHSTAYDMALLAAEAVRNSDLREIASLTVCDITVNSKAQTIYNHNKLLSADKCFIGLKTGYTKKAGRCLVSAYEYGSSVIVCVTLNAPDDWNDHKKLVSFAKKCYKHIIKKTHISVGVVGGSADTVGCCYKYDCRAIDNVYIKEYYYPIIYAPLEEDEVIGRAEIYSNGVLLCVEDIKTTKGVSLWQITK